MAEANKAPEPVRQSVHVDCPIEEAFRLFTEEFGTWWPLASHSMSGDEAETCAIDPWTGGKVFERTRSGEELEWGTVTLWDPPRHIEFTWQAAGEREGQTVDIEFQVEADGTKVTVVHQGWQLGAVPSCAIHAHFARFVCEQVLAAV